MTNTEADTCRKFVVPKLQAASWDTISKNDVRRLHELSGGASSIVISKLGNVSATVRNHDS